MKLKSFLFIFIVNISFMQAQSFAVANSMQPTCFGACDGFVTYTTGLGSGPFTAVVTNTGTCPNSTVQSSTGNTITINNICACADIYTVTIKTLGNIVVGTELIQFPAYATSPLVVLISSITAESCTGCCDGRATVGYTGGNVQGTPTYSVDGAVTSSVTPVINLCNGTHTICMQDASNCIACKVFNTPLAAGLHENSFDLPIRIYPNPAKDALFIESSPNNAISKVEIFDLTGRKISGTEIQNASETKVKLDLNSLTEGLYYLNVYNTYGQLMQHKKFVKNE